VLNRFLDKAKKIISPQVSDVAIDPVIPVLKGYFGNRRIRVVEIGARYGDSTERILAELNVEKYIIIDPYETYDGYGSDGFNQVLSASSDAGDLIYQRTVDRFSARPVEFIRMYSSEAASMIKDESIDLVFIDGNHRYDYVREDVISYMPKLVSGGIACGDDYFMRHDDVDFLGTLDGDYREKMVWEAVNECCSEMKLDVYGYGMHCGYPRAWLAVKH